MTGGGGGIGGVACSVFATHGYKVAVSDVRPEAVQSTVEAVREAGGVAEGFVADISDPAQTAALFEEIIAKWGRLDAAFNNAGLSGGGIPLADLTEEEWDRNLRVNLTGTWRCMKHEITIMLGQGGGVIVNNCSTLGINGGVSAAYTSTKHGIAGLTKSAAITYAAKGIRVNAVCPGFIDSGMGANLVKRGDDAMRRMIALHPVGRAGTALEVAQAAVWLCSDQASYIHGHLLAVDGGFSSH